MRSLSKCILGLAVSVLLAGSAVGADALATGKIKSVEADNKTFVMTDAAGKDWTFAMGENLSINRAGKEGKLADLKPGEEISVLYDKGVVKSTAAYVLLHDGEKCMLGRGTVKAWDSDKKRLTLTGLDNKVYTFNVGMDTKVQRAGTNAKIDDLKVDDKVTVVYEGTGDKLAVKQVIADRK